MVSSLTEQTNFKRDEYRSKLPSKLSKALTIRALKYCPPYLFRSKVLPTSSVESTTGIDFEDEEGDELSLVKVPESGSSSFGEASKVASLASNLSS